LKTMLHTAQQTKVNPTSTVHESIASTLAKSTALKAGQKLSQEEMTNLIESLFACSNHSFTPDGKKIMTVWSQEEIDAKMR